MGTQNKTKPAAPKAQKPRSKTSFSRADFLNQLKSVNLSTAAADVADGGENTEAVLELRDECTLRIAGLDLARWCRPAVEQGDFAAGHALAMLYLSGLIPGVNPAEGIPLLRYCASKDHAPSLFVLGRCHESGIFVRQEPERAYRLYLSAAEQGDVDALLALESYCAIRGIRQESKYWGKKAAEASATVPEMDVLLADIFTECEE